MHKAISGEAKTRQLLSVQGYSSTKAAGSYDDAGMTRGIAGFTVDWSEEVEDPATKK